MASFGENFGALIRRKREEDGLSLAQTALRAFGDEDKQSRISELENGAVQRPHAKTINAFIEAFDLSPEEIEECRKDTPLSKKHVSDMTAEEYEERLDIRVAKVTAALSAAHEKEKSQLQAEIDTLQQRAAEPERALEEAKARIAELEPKLDRLSNIIDPEKIAAAKTAMQDEDYTLARELLEEQRAKAVLQKRDADQSLAEIEYDLGLIAEAEIRWHDALTHFEKSADLYATFKTCERAGKQNWLNGKPDKALHYVSKMKDLASTHNEKSFALNSEALLYRAQGKYDQAEPLYLQAIEIDKKTIGEEHPDYATDLNNLALLYDVQGKYDQAEPLYLQAIEIDKKTIGEHHPEYAKHLNNLAALYDAQGKYDQAEPLYLQALEIGKKTIGEEHPSYAIRLNNLAKLYREQGKYDQAEPLFLQAIDIATATLGADHPNTKTMEKNYQTFLQSKP